MKKLFILISILSTSIILGQAQYLSNAVNTPTPVANPTVFIGALPKPIGTFEVYIKDNIRWETYNINNFNSQVISTTSSLYKPISYIPSSLEIETSLGYLPLSIEIDPIWTSVSSTYRTKIQNDLLYEPIFSKNTAFNKNFGTSVSTITEGNDSRVNNGQTAFGWGNHASIGYLLSSVAVSTYQLIGTYLTPTSTNILTNKTGNISQWTNDVNYLTSISFTGKTTTDLSEGTNLYFNNSRSRSAISLTTTGTGVATYNNTTGIMNIPTPVLNSGTVTSIGITGSDFSITNTPITTSGNIGLSLSTTGITNGTYGRLTVDTKGRATAGKRQEPYSGVTDASGNYTIVFSTAYSTIPNIQVCLINPNIRDTPVPSVSTTGFTINVQRRVDVLGLLPTYGNVVGGNVHVLITEN